MIPDWKTNRVLLAAALRHRRPKVWSDLRQAFQDERVEFGLMHDTADIWLRDFAPVQVGPDEFVLFRYQPDYLRHGFQHLITEESVRASVVSDRCCTRSVINLDGGNLVASERTVVLTKKVFRENPEFSPRQLERELVKLLQVDRCIFVPTEPGDPLGHADGMLRFLDEHTVLVNDYAGVDKEFGRHLRAVLQSQHLDIEEVPYFPEEQVTDGIPSAVGAWINFLRTDRLIVVPVFCVEQDEQAVRKLESVFPGIKVVAIRCTGLARGGGCLHCISWTTQVPRRAKEGQP